MLFLDTANLKEIEDYLKWGCFRGVTTNPKILQSSGERYSKEAYHKNIRRICDLVDGPVSVELTGSVLNACDEGATLHRLADNVVVKVPMWPDGVGMKVIALLHEKRIPVNATVLMKSSQAILAADAGAEYVSLFYRRMCDYGGLEATKKEFSTLKEYLKGSSTKIIAGSIRQPIDVVNCLKYGADIVTVPPKNKKYPHLLWELVNHPKTEATIAEFDAAWREYTSG